MCRGDGREISDRRAATGLAHKPRARRTRELPVRSIQYPFVPLGAGTFHGDRNENRLPEWKTAVRGLLFHLQQRPEK